MKRSGEDLVSSFNRPNLNPHCDVLLIPTIFVVRDNSKVEGTNDLLIGHQLSFVTIGTHLRVSSTSIRCIELTSSHILSLHIARFAYTTSHILLRIACFHCKPA